MNKSNAENVRKIASRQAARVVLTKQTQFVREMIEEGLLKPKDAEDFYAVIEEDEARLEQDGFNNFT